MRRQGGGDELKQFMSSPTAAKNGTTMEWRDYPKCTFNACLYFQKAEVLCLREEYAYCRVLESHKFTQCIIILALKKRGDVFLVHILQT